MKSYIFSILILFFLNSLIAQEKKVTIFFSASDNGHILGCCCPVSPKSGMIKRAAFLEDLRKIESNDFLHLSTGDIFSPGPDLPKSELILKAIKTLRYDAIVFGDQEFANGEVPFNSFLEGGNVLCANIQLGGDFQSSKISPYKIFSRNALKIAIVGIVSPDSFRWFGNKSLLSKITIGSPSTVVKTLFPKLKKENDLLVVLFHGGIDEAKTLFSNSDADFVICGHDQVLTSTPVRVGRTHFLQSGANGSWLGELVISYNKNIIDHSVNFHFFRHSYEFDGKTKCKKNIEKAAILEEYQFKKYKYTIHENYPDSEEIRNSCIQSGKCY